MVDRKTAEVDVMTCTSCGEDATEFREGYCVDCFWDRQSRLDEHNARCDWWGRLSDQERGLQIKAAMRLA